MGWPPHPLFGLHNWPMLRRSDLWTHRVSSTSSRLASTPWATRSLTSPEGFNIVAQLAGLAQSKLGQRHEGRMMSTSSCLFSFAVDLLVRNRPNFPTPYRMVFGIRDMALTAGTYRLDSFLVSWSTCPEHRTSCGPGILILWLWCSASTQDYLKTRSS